MTRIDKLTEYFNAIYANEGFTGVIRAVEANLNLGRVKAKGDRLFCITTGGWSDDEDILESLTSIFSLFGQNHYVGYVVGGAYYFDALNKAHQHEIRIRIEKDEEE